MDKVRLALDELEVQSFATTSASPDRKGTVHGHAPTDQWECPTLDQNWDTCGWTCWSQCGSCNDSCDCYSGMCTGSESFLATNCQ